MDFLLRLVICILSVVILVQLAGFYDDLMRWRDRRRWAKQQMARWKRGRY